MSTYRTFFSSKERDSYWKMMQKYIGSDITSMVTLPVLIFEPMTMLQKMAEVPLFSLHALPTTHNMPVSLKLMILFAIFMTVNGVLLPFRSSR